MALRARFAIRSTKQLREKAHIPDEVGFRGKPHIALSLVDLCGALTGGLLMAVGKMQRRSALPFGVFMAFGGVVTLFVGPKLWEFYLSLLGGGI